MSFWIERVKTPTAQPLSKQLPCVIAVTGCDGAGKSTLSEDLLAQLDPGAPIQWLYLGQSSGNIARWIKDLPLVGPPIGRYLVSKADKADEKESTSTDTATTLVMFILSHWRAHKFRRMLKLSRRGVVVITDRYPQAEVPGFHFDGPGLGAVNPEGWLGRKLTMWEQRQYQRMASHVPALVIRLNIDADTAHQRKPDHKLSILKDKVTILPKLHFNGADILDLDGRAPYEQVLETALGAARAALRNHRS
ncbi:Thymidylate kinase [Halioglobus japonicus]|nr:Thymidylate kinase [Halioglobus japonicus]